jgi:hypothetical protein
VQLAVLSMKNVGCAMYPWPFGEFDSVMDDALNIAMDYLMRTGQAMKFQEAQEVAGRSRGARGSGTGCGFPAWQFGPWNRKKVY